MSKFAKLRFQLLLPLIAAFGMFFAAPELVAADLHAERLKFGPLGNQQEDREFIAEVFIIAAGAPCSAICIPLKLIPGDNFALLLITFSICLVAQWYFIGLFIDARRGLGQHPFDPPRRPGKLVLLITLRLVFGALILLAPLAILSASLVGLLLGFFYGFWGALGTSLGFQWSNRLSGKAEEAI